MKNLTVLICNETTQAFKIREALAELESESGIEVTDAVVVTRDAAGKVELHQSTIGTATGAAIGSVAGMIVGMLFLNPLAGSVVGASSGAAIGSKVDLGLDDKFMLELGATFAPGTSALFVLSSKGRIEEVVRKLQPFAGNCQVLQTSLDQKEEQIIRRLFEGSGNSGH
jgi:uncharacterized membrane protein